jgi:hypothetical protein
VALQVGSRRSGRHPAAVLATVANLPELPDSWDVSQPGQLREALELLMPGQWHQGHITGLSKKMPGAVGFLQPAGPGGELMPECVPTMETEVLRLLECVQLGLCVNVLDPFSGTGTIAKVLGCRHRRVVTNDIHLGHAADYTLDALQPSSYGRLRSSMGGLIDSVVTSPWSAALDLALPLLVASVATVACVHVPGHYFTSAVEPRAAYLRSLQEQGRLFVVLGLPRGPIGRRCMWLVVFASSAVPRQRLLTPACRQLEGWSM